MRRVAYETQYSVEAGVSRAFAWGWRTDVRNWDDPPAEFALEGPFVEGSRGTTRLPGRAPLDWQIGKVEPGRFFVLDMPLPGATLSFEWSFDMVTEQRTRLTQRIVLSGDDADRYAHQVQAAFGSTLADGMNRIASALTRAAESAEAAGSTRCTCRALSPVVEEQPSSSWNDPLRACHGPHPLTAAPSGAARRRARSR